MKRIFYLSLTSFALGLTSCGSQETASNAQPNLNRTSNTAPQTYINNNGQGATTNSAENNTNIVTPANRLQTKMEQQQSAANNQSQKAAPVNTRPAPEDSEITTTLTDVAREVRVWKKHPTLAKIEKTYSGQNISIKVYLRDGRVIDLPGSAIAQLDQIPSATVLTLVGVGPTAQKPSVQKENPLKKASN